MSVFGAAMATFLFVAMVSTACVGADSGFGPLSLVAQETVPEKSAVEQIVRRWGSIPKGVVLEGQGGDFGKVADVAYDKPTNTFRIDGAATYANPVSMEDMQAILQSIEKDDRIGVSLGGVDGKKLIVYGELAARSNVIRALEDCDNFLGDIVLAIEECLKKTEVVGGYKPKKPAHKSRDYAVFFAFGDYKFKKLENAFHAYSSTLDITLVPLKAEVGADGGLMPDYEALEKEKLPQEYLDNVSHVQANEETYKVRKEVAQVVLYGEAAAFARSLKKSGVSPGNLARLMK